MYALIEMGDPFQSVQLFLGRFATTLHTFVHGIERREVFGFFVVRATLVVANT